MLIMFFFYVRFEYYLKTYFIVTIINRLQINFLLNKDTQ